MLTLRQEHAVKRHARLLPNRGNQAAVNLANAKAVSLLLTSVAILNASFWLWS